MATTLAQHYTDELSDWDESITFYNEEMGALNQKLVEVIRRNCIIGIAEQVEAHQIQLNALSDKFDKIQDEIQQQEAELKTDDTLIEDSLINFETEKLQTELRAEMQAAEKEYIDVKFDCYNFLTKTLKNHD